MRTPQPLLAEVAERLAAMLKEAKNKAEYQRIQCVWLRAALHLPAPRIATALGWQVGSGRQVHSDYLRQGETADICVTGYTKKVRNVPAAVKRQVYAAYRVVNTPGAYEVDHLIPLELGGSNSLKNLWPESYNIEWNAHIKDELENRLHGLACRGTVPLRQAQQEIATDWIAAYQKYFHTDHPLTPAEARQIVRRRR